MDAGATLRRARRRAGLSQRDVARAAGVPQSTVARIESGLIDPRLSTMVELLAACGDELEALPRLGEGVDITLIDELLKLSHTKRFDQMVAASRNVRRFREAIRWPTNSIPKSLSRR